MRARRRTPATLLLGTTSSSARRHSAGYCFVPDCERVRVDGGAALRVLQGRPVRREANPCFRPREGIRAEPARRPGKRGKQALLQSHTRSHARFVLRAAVCALRAKGRGGPATSLSRRELHETTAISSRRAPAPTWLFVGLLGVFRGNWRVPESLGVPISGHVLKPARTTRNHGYLVPTRPGTDMAICRAFRRFPGKLARP